MREPGFKKLTEELLAAGLSPRQVQRTTDELRDHFFDIAAESMEAGKTSAEAATEARERLGSEDQVLQAILQVPELRSWSNRHVGFLRPVQFFVLAPIMPIVVCIESREFISRWCAAVCISALITGSMFLGIHLLILFG